MAITLAVFAMNRAFVKNAAAETSAAHSTATVFTRARVVSLGEEAGNKFYIRLQLLPRAKLPFSTQTFLVKDRTMVADISKGVWVKFTSRSIEGDNVLTTIQVVPECVRFQRCD